MAQRTVNGARLFYEEQGAGETVLLLHGIGSSGLDWEYQVPEFAKHYRVIVPDLRGFGRSEHRPPFSVEQWAADAWALLDSLGVERCHLLGYSMGGAVAMQMALDQPRRIQRLVLSNTLPSLRPDGWRKRWLLVYRLLMMGLLGPQRLSDAVGWKLFPRDDQRELRQRVAARNGAFNDRVTYLRAGRALVAWSVQDRMAQLTMPTLVLAAEQDYFSVADTEAFVRALPNARLKTFAGTRHGLPLEAPVDYNRTVLEFLTTS